MRRCYFILFILFFLSYALSSIRIIIEKKKKKIVFKREAKKPKKARSKKKLVCDELISGRCAPYFALIGAMKCGTNAFSSYILQQPHIVLSPYQEFHYFSDGYFSSKLYAGAFEKNISVTIPNPRIKRKYAHSFAKTDWVHNFTFDKSPGYMQPGESIPRRMKRLIPRFRIVALLCDPVERFFSHYHHLYRHKLLGQQQDKNFTEYTDWALQDTRTRLRTGYYVDLLKSYVKWFGRDRVYLLDSVRLFSDPVNTLTEMLLFLKIPVQKGSWKVNKFKPVYQNPEKVGKKVPERERRKLVQAYFESVTKLVKDLKFNHSWINFL